MSSKIREKPKPESRPLIDFLEAEKWIEQKLGHPLRDCLSSEDHYGQWCKAHRETPCGNDAEQYARYRQAQDGYDSRPEYRDYWHLLVDRCDIHNPCVIQVTPDLLKSGTEPWQDEITRAFIAEFGPDAEYWVEW